MTTLVQSYSIGDSEMYVSDVSTFPTSGYVTVSVGSNIATVSYGSVNVEDETLCECEYDHGARTIYPIGSTVTATKTPYFSELKTIYYREEITLEQKVELMLQALGLTENVKKWCDAIPVDGSDDTKGRNWTNPDTQEVVFLDYETYGVPAERYAIKYAHNFVGPMNRSYYEQ